MSIDGNSKPNEPKIEFYPTVDIFSKALGACVICYLTRKLSCRAGLAYGGLAGVIQLLFLGIHEKIDEKTSLHSVRTLNYTVSAYLPWAISGYILRQIYKNTGNPSTRVTSGMGLSIALIQQVLGRGNINLLPKD